MSNQYLKIPESIALSIKPKVRLFCVFYNNTSSSALEMLQKIYLACGLDSEKEVQELLWEKPIRLAVELSKENKPDYIVSFGLKPNDLGASWETRPYQWINVNSQRWCFAEKLEDIQADMDKKKLLWGCLKELKS